jgi:WD40 repeat protein
VIALSPDGKTLASTSLDGTARLWSMAQRQEGVILPGQAGMNGVDFLAFSGDGRRLAVGAQDGIARLWDLTTNRPPRAFQVDPERAGMVQVALSSDGKTLVAGRVGLYATFGGGVRAWSVATGSEIFHLDTWLYALAFSPDGRHLALSTLQDHASAVELWDLRRGHRVGRFPGGVGVSALAFSPDGRTLAGGGMDGIVRLWDVDGRSLLCPLSGHTNWVMCLAFSHDGATLASGGFDGTVRLWDVPGRRERCPPLQPHGAPPWGLAFSRDGRTLAMTNQTRGVLLWNVETRQQAGTLIGHKAGVCAIAFSPNGDTLATGANDDTVRLWRAPPFAATDAGGAPPASAAMTERQGR